MVRIKCIALLISLLIPFSGLMGQEAYKNILIFFGDNETRPAYGRIVEGIKSAFPKGSPTTVNVILEYLDLERFSDSIHLHQVVELYNKRVRASAIDLIVTVAPGAYDALNEAGLKLLHLVPVIALEMSPQDPERYRPEMRVVELEIEWSPQKSMMHAFSLFPGYRHAMIIGGCSDSDRMFNARLLKDTSHFKDTHQFTLLTCVSIDSILEVVSRVSDSTLIFMSSFITDADSNRFSSALALGLISSESPVPVFTMSDNFIDYGGVGGHIVSFLEVGKEVGEIARDMFENYTSNGLTKISKSYYRHQYNWKELRKWEILDSKVIPADSTFFYKDFNFLTQYRWQIIGVFMFILMQAVLIYFLIRLARRQKKVSLQKAENEKLYRRLVHEDRLTLMAQLTASLAHELNQPLAAILFNAQAGLRFLASGKLDDQQVEAILSGIVEDDKRAGDIISSVRKLMKKETREKGRVDLVAVIKETIRILHLDMERQSIQVIFNDSSEPVYVFGDLIQLQQVFMNFFLNAAFALSSNGDRPKQIQIKLSHSNSNIIVFFEDNGPGIDEAMRLKLFDAFVTTKEDGLGIGLAICKSIVQNHGGKIIAGNRDEGGAVFSITLQAYTNGK